MKSKTCIVEGIKVYKHNQIEIRGDFSTKLIYMLVNYTRAYGFMWIRGDDFLKQLQACTYHPKR